MNYADLFLSAIITAIGTHFTLLNIASLNNDEKTNINIPKFVFSIMIMSILVILNKLFFVDINKLVLSSLIIIIIAFYTIFNKDIVKSIFYGLIFIIFNIIIEVTVSLIFLIFFKYSIDIYNDLNFSMSIFSTGTILILLLISKISKLKLLLNNVYKKVMLKSSSIFIFSIFTFYLIVICVNNYYIYNNNLTYFINLGIMIIVLISLSIVIYNKFQKQKFEDKYNQMIEYVSKYEKIINEQGKKNHEYNNQLMVLSGYVNNPKKLKEYLKLIIEDQKGNQNYTIKQLGYFPDGGIKGLIYDKLSVMEENNIKPFLYINQDIKDIFEKQFDIRTYSDITKLLGVFLDNAIDASKKAELKEIEIEMKLDDNYLIISIGNTYDKNINLDKIGKKGFSTKGLGHGFGLSIVKDISKNNSKIETFSEATEDMYRQIIMIDLK